MTLYLTVSITLHAYTRMLAVLFLYKLNKIQIQITFFSFD
jgi:hypothetical protein